MDNTCDRRYHFVIVGSGWRSLYYVRIAKALPEVFCLDAMYCRTEEKAALMAEKHGIHTTVSVGECRAYRPDFVVVVVNKQSIAEASLLWMGMGFTVLCETPAALDEGMLERLWRAEQKGGRLVVAEQYTEYPSHAARLNVLKTGIIGDISCVNISHAHEYHGASLMRAYLGVDAGEHFRVRAKTYEFPTAETMTRYEKITDGRIALKKRTVATFEFDSGKVAFYDFDSEQYRSPIRKNTLKVQGVRGEMVDDDVFFLNEENEPKERTLTARVVLHETGDPNPNLSVVRSVVSVGTEAPAGTGVVCFYESPFGEAVLSEDETAIATLMLETGKYNRGEAPSPYALKDALTDAYTAILLARAVETGTETESETKIWML